MISYQNLSLMLGLSFFFGLSFEGFYWKSAASRPGGIRSFPLLSLTGAVLYSIEPQFSIALCAGLLVLGAWLYPYYRAEVKSAQKLATDPDGIMVPLCNVVAYLLGPVTLTQPPWVAVALTVAAVFLLRARDRLHSLAERLPAQEIITFAQFLVLVGVVLPLLPNQPVTHLTPITPFQVWLAVVVISSLSYGSYLLQNLLSNQQSLFFTSVLGGLYSSTATSVVLARQLRANPTNRHEVQSGIVLATALMYLRLGVVVAIFNFPLARKLALPLAALFAAALIFAALCLALGFVRRRRELEGESAQPTQPRNPLELSAALVFAILFVLVSVVSLWAKIRFGQVGIFWLAAIVGVTDIDPFVLSVAQGGVSGLEPTAIGVAVLIAASSNNLLKSGYCIAFGGWWKSLPAVLSLLLLGVLGAVIAYNMANL